MKPLPSVKRWLQRRAQGLVAFFERQVKLAEKNDLMARGLLVLGRHTYGQPKVWMSRGSECKVVIGNFCSIAPGVQCVAGGIHPAAWISTYPFRIRWGLAGAYEDGMPATQGDIVIGSDVWIGTDAMILSGVQIGHGAIVAARSVVTRSVPPYAVVAGVPARVVKHRFEADVVARLLQMAWWDWSDDQIQKAVPLLSSGEVDRFLREYGPAAGA
jgi:acetyltransferase-like isoleucine patch superfamily enzyme